jgi:hypothetical protein
LEDPGIDGRITLKWTFKKWDVAGWHGLDQSGSEEGQVADSCECGDESLGSIKCREFID